ncbi:hypothetical protein RS030_203140 [Cryptosporidium xiaoi]|uniref:Uncharacterized protein n=1 Tax=Cryptosporidium xiaoi TaxID=659607 RepID=A0AAV9Y3G2_9CRYT
MFSMRSGIIFSLSSICYLIFLSGVNAITTEEIWFSLRQLTSATGSAECRKLITDINGNPPDIVLRSAKNKNEIFDICLASLSKIVDECGQPSFQAGYTFFESGGSSMKLVGGTKSVSRSDIKKTLTRFCQVVAKNLEHKLTPGMGQPPYPTVPYPTMGFQFPTGPSLPSVPTLPPSGPVSPHSEEWKKLVASALLGTASKYVSRIPTVPYPLFTVGKNDEEKKVNCLKALRNMVENSERTGEKRFLGDKIVYTVTSLTENNIQLREELIIVANRDDPILVKEMIKKFCDDSYGGKPVTEKHAEWVKIHRASLSSSVVQNLPSEPPIFYEFDEVTGLGLMEACNKVIKQLVSTARSREQRISPGKYPVSVSIAGSYISSDGFRNDYGIRINCKGQGTEQELAEAVAKFCRGIYKRPSGGEKGKDKQRLLDALYSHIQKSTLFASPFRGFPVQPPYFLNRDSYFVKLDSNGDTTLENKIQVCTKFLIDCSQKSEKSEVIDIKYGFSGSYQPTYDGVLKGQHLKMHVEWGPPVGKAALEFPMLDLRNFPGYTLEKVAKDFCSKVMSTFTFSIKTTTPPYSPGPYQHPSPSPPPPPPPPPPPSPPPVLPPIPSMPMPIPSIPSPIQTPYPVSQYKYTGRRPPIGYPQSLSEKLYVQAQVTQATITHSNDIWSRLCQHSNFGLGSDKIRGLSGSRPASFIAPGPKAALEHACYNLFANIYSFASSYRLSSDESTLEVTRNMFDGSTQGQATPGMINLIFYLSQAPKNLPYGGSVSALIELFCRSFVDSL